jgi:small subunit ribosomal protein S21
MLVVQVKEGENIERALKRYKNKFNRTKVVRELRDRKQYIKPTVANRKTKLKAAYIQNKYGLES